MESTINKPLSREDLIANTGFKLSNPKEKTPRPTWAEDLSYIDADLKIPTRAELLANAPSAKDIRRIAENVAIKAEEDGIKALDAEERRYYDYYLTLNSYKMNARGEVTRPISGNIADLIINANRLFILNSDVYLYDPEDGTYKRDADGKQIRKLIKDALIREVVDNKNLTDIYSLILGDAEISIGSDQINKRPAHWIHFKNGYYDYRSGRLYPHNPDYNEINVIPWEYSPSRYPSGYKFEKKSSGILSETVEAPLRFNSWISEAIPDPEDQIMLLQYIGYSLTLSTNEQKFLLICGSGGTGKSTILKLIETMIGAGNISGVSLQDLQDQYAPGELYLKQANICADIPLSALSEVDMIKRLTGEDTITANRKFKPYFTFRSYARLFFSANDIPAQLSDGSNAFYRRMLILRMDHAPEIVDPDLFNKLRAEIPNIITRAVEEIAISGGTIQRSANCERLVETAHKNSDTVEAYILDRCEIGSGYRVNRVALYSDYCNYCDQEGRKYKTANGFYKALDSKGYKRAEGRTRDFIGLKIAQTFRIIGKCDA